jgi:hypothetical protein
MISTIKLFLKPFILLTVLININCSDYNRNNPMDPGSKNYSPNVKNVKIINQNTLEAFDDNNELIWQYTVDATINKVEINDINESDKNEIIFITSGTTKNTDAGKVYLLSNKGNLLKEYNSIMAHPYLGPRSERFIITNFIVDNLFDTSDKYIILIARDCSWYPSRLFILDKNLSLISNYWNPGHIADLYIEKINQNKKIIIWGINNDFRRYFSYGDLNIHFTAMLDPNKLEGQAPPYLGNIINGKQDWYSFFVPPSPYVEIISIEFPDINYDNIKDVTIWTSIGYVYSLNETGVPIQVAMGDNAGQRPEYHLFITIDGYQLISNIY